MTTSVCKHGASRERHKEWAKGFAWMEAHDTCACCGTIEFTFYGMVPPDTCRECGGHEKTWDEMKAEANPPEPPPKTLAERLADFKAKKRNSGGC